MATRSPILVDYLGNAMRIPLLLPGALADRAGFIRDARARWKAALVLAVFSPLACVLVLYRMQRRRCRGWRRRARCRCCSPRCSVAGCWARPTAGCVCSAPPAWLAAWCCWRAEAARCQRPAFGFYVATVSTLPSSAISSVSTFSFGCLAAIIVRSVFSCAAWVSVSSLASLAWSGPRITL